jgi:hypothetical protein
MGRPKGSKNKPKDKATKLQAKAKTKAKPPTKAETPDWLRKAMADPKPKTSATLKRGRKPMANKPSYDPMDDPDLRASTKGDLPTGPDIKPPVRPDNTLPENPVRPGQPLPLPGGGVRPDNALPEPEEPETKYDEVASGEVIPAENAQMLIAGTLGGSGDNHASTKRILARFEEVGWEIRKALDAGTGDTRKGKAKKGKEDDAKASYA